MDRNTEILRLFRNRQLVEKYGASRLFLLSRLKRVMYNIMEKK